MQMTKKTDSLNKKLLDAALKAKKAKEIKDLINQGADIYCVNDWGLTPIMIAAQNNPSLVVLNALIDAGSDVKATEPKYRSNPLHLAANRNTNPKVISALVKAGVDLNSRNYLGETPLIMAVNDNDETKMVTALIKEGADINARDYQNRSVLEYAILRNRTYVINTLKKLGAN
jgi:ankyrin repeat protein